MLFIRPWTWYGSDGRRPPCITIRYLFSIEVNVYLFIIGLAFALRSLTKTCYRFDNSFEHERIVHDHKIMLEALCQIKRVNLRIDN